MSRNIIQVVLYQLDQVKRRIFKTVENKTLLPGLNYSFSKITLKIDRT